MKRLIILFILIFNLTFAKTINLNLNNYDKYVFNGKEKVYSIVYGITTTDLEKYKYYLYETDKKTGNTKRTFSDAQTLQVLSAFLISKEAYAIEIFPKEINNDNGKN